ncbi:TPR domain-containing protein [Fusarium denticulatum]|uniref:TPR domain-containing protein n=1 Tax=Fusarium denticulatum TaxID=48507 RepID=A0A8H5U622_9HYPO|nr:TPR domain-containing protein [Fusarium denticulatum]
MELESEDGYAALLKELKDDMIKAALSKGQLVTDYPDPEALAEAFRQESTRNNGTQEKKPAYVTQIPEPYEPCLIPEKDLELMPISDMRLQTRHCGKKVLLRVKTAPAQAAAIMTIVEDQEGTAVLLSLYQQLHVDLLTIRHPAQDSVAILKDPFFEKIADKTYSLQIYHPSDIIWLEDNDERIPEQWRVHREIKSSAEYRAEGEELANKEHWLPALHSYTLATDTAESPDEKQQAHLGRSEVNLQLGRPHQALRDAIEGDHPTDCTEESLLLQARAFYSLGDFGECLQRLRVLTVLFPKSVLDLSMQSTASKRLKEQDDGEYAFEDMLVEAQETPPLIDCATFSSLVEIRDAPGRGKGLFLTKDVSAGDLVLCEKAFSYCFMDGNSHKTYPILANVLRDEAKDGGSVYLWTQVTQKLYHNPEHIDTIQELFHGDHKKLQITECDRSTVVDSFMVERIIHYNAVNTPKTTSNDFETRVFSKKGSSLEIDNMDSKYSTSGIWLLASRINHSCVSNCRRSFIGDMQIIRATHEMSAGTELLLSYRTPITFESYEEVQKRLSTWGFKCACDICKSRSKENKATLEKRRKIYDEALDLLKTQVLQFNFAKARTLLKQLENTYKGKSANKVRLELAELCFAMGDRYTESVMPVDFVRMSVKSLESLGFVIVAYVPGQKPDDYRFEVKKWGMSTNYVVYLFLNLAHMYGIVSRQLSIKVFNYAIISYRMLVGEVVSMPRLLPDAAEHFNSIVHNALSIRS